MTADKKMLVFADALANQEQSSEGMIPLYASADVLELLLAIKKNLNDLAQAAATGGVI